MLRKTVTKVGIPAILLCLLCLAIIAELMYQGQKIENAALTESLNQSTDTIAGLRDTLNMVSTESAYQLAQRDSILAEKDSILIQKDSIVEYQGVVITMYRKKVDTLRECVKSSVATITDLKGQLAQAQAEKSSLYSQLDNQAHQDNALKSQVADLSEAHEKSLCCLSSLILSLIRGKHDDTAFYSLDSKLAPFCTQPSDKIYESLYRDKCYQKLRKYGYDHAMDLGCLWSFCRVSGIDPKSPDIGQLRNGLRAIRDNNFKILLLAAGATEEEANEIEEVSKNFDI